MPFPISSSIAPAARVSPGDDQRRRSLCSLGRIATVMAALAVASSGFGQTVIWNGAGTNFNTAGNWTGGSPANKIGQFDTVKTAPNNQVFVSGNITVAGLEFTANSGAWEFGGTNGGSAEVLTIGASGIVNNSAFTQTFSGIPSTDLTIHLGANTAFTSNGTGAIQLTSGLSDFQNNGYTLTLNGTSQSASNLLSEVLSGTGGLTKSGTGTWSSTVNHDYTGATRLSGGVLAISNLANGGTASQIGASSNAAGNLILDGGTLRLTGGNDATNRLFTLTENGGTIEATNGTVNFSNTGTIATSGVGDRTLTLGGTNTGNNYMRSVIVDAASGKTSITKEGSGTWIMYSANTYTGATTINDGILRLQSHDRLSDSTAVTIAAPGVLDLALYNETVGSLAGAGTVRLTGTTNRTFTVGGDNTTTTFSGTLEDTGSGNLLFAKTGNGTLTLSGSNTNAGGFALNGGTLALGSAGALSTSGTISFGGGTLRFGAANTTDYSNRFSTTAGQNYRIDTNGQAVTFASNLTSSGGSLTKLGDGTLTLAGNNTYSGGTNLDGGTLALGSANAIGASGTIGFNGGTLQFSGSNATDYSSRFNTGSDQAYRLDTNGQSVVLASNLSSFGGSLTKLGEGTLTVGSANSYTGVTTIGRGTLVASDLSVNSGVSSLGNATSAVLLGDGSNSGTLSYTGNSDTFTRGLTVNAGGGRFNVTTAGQTLTMASAGIATNGLFTIGGAGNTTLDSTSAVSGAGGLYKADTGTLTISSANAHTGGTTIAGGTVTVTSGGSLAANNGALGMTGGTLNLNNAAQTVGAFNGSGGTVNLSSGHEFTVNTSTTDAFSGTLAGAGSLTKSGSGSLALAGNNSALSGGITLSAGTLAFNSAQASGSGMLTINGGTLDNTSGGAVTLAGNNAQTWAGNFSFTGTQSLDLGTGAVTLTGNRTITVNNNTLTIGGAIGDGPNAYGITKEGAGTLVFGGVNTYDGTTTLNAGTLTVNSGAALASSTSALVVNAGTLNLNNAAQTIASLTGSGGTVNLGSGHTLTVNNASNNTYAGLFSGNGNLTKSGAGTLTLSGNSSSYSGVTTIGSGGVVNVQHKNALGTGNIIVENGATLQLQTGGLSFGSSAGATVTLSGAGTGIGGNNAALINVGGGITRLNNSVVLDGATTLSSGTTSGARLSVGGAPPGPTPGVSAPDNDTLTLNGNKLTLIGGAGTTVRIDANITDGSGAADVDINTSGTVEFNANKNTYTGDTNVLNGTLVVRTVNNGFAPNTPPEEAVSFHGISGALNIGNGSGADNTAIVQLGGSAGTANNVIKSTSAVTIASDGHLDLNGNVQNVGKLTLNGGSIDANGGTLYLDYANTSVDVNLSGTQTPSTIAGTVSLTFHKHAATEGAIPDYERIFRVGQTTYGSPDLTISGNLINGGLIKQGDGLMNLTSSINEYLGRTTVAEGILRVGVGTEYVSGNHRSSLGAGDNNGSANADTVVNSGATLQLQGDIALTNEALTLSGNGYDPAGATAPIGALHSTGNNTWGSNSTTGIIKLGANSRITSASGNLTLASTISSTTGNSFGLTIDGAGDTTITGSINTGTSAASLTKTGTGTLTLAALNGYQGATTINQGTVIVQHNRGLGANTAGATGTTVASGAELQLDAVGSDIAIGGESIAIAGTGTSGSGALRSVDGNNSIGGTVSLSSNALITANTGASLALVGGVSGGGHTLTVGTTAQNGDITVSGNFTNSTGSLVKNGSGLLTLSGGTATTGAIQMNAGTTTITSASTTATTVNVAGGTLNFNGTNTSTGNITVNGGALSFGGTSATTGQVNLLNGTVDVGGSSTVNTEEFAANAGTTLTIASGGLVVADYSSGSTTFSGAMAGGGTFEKAGGGTLVFDNSFDATDLTLEISGGILKLNNAAHITFDTIKITGDTILDFSNSANTWLSSANLEIAANVKVTVINWIAVANNSAASTIWYANQLVNNTPLSGGDQIGTPPLDQISFVDLNGPNFPTTWVDGSHDGYFDHEIRPTPEPGTYGVIFLSACFGLLAWRRFRASRSAASAALA